MAAEAEPRPRRGDVIGRARPLGLQEERELDEVLAVPRRERREELEALAVGGDLELDLRAVRGRGEVAVEIAHEAVRGKIGRGLRGGQRERLAVAPWERVLQRVEGEATG